MNTMYRAYMGSNHKPELTVYAPAAYSEAKDNVIPAYQEIPVSFLPQDPDLTDRKLHVKIEFTYTFGSKEVTETKYDSAQTDSSSVFSASYKNPLPAGGDLTVRIYAADKHGAWTEEIIPVKIREISANLQVSRSASGLLKDTLAERGKEFLLNYSIVPKPVQNQTGQAEHMAITAPAFSEKLPPNLEVTALPDGISKSGTLAAGYTLSGGLPDIRYSADGSGKTYTAIRQPPGDGQGDADRQLCAKHSHTELPQHRTDCTDERFIWHAVNGVGHQADPALHSRSDAGCRGHVQTHSLLPANGRHHLPPDLEIQRCGYRHCQ